MHVFLRACVKQEQLHAHHAGARLSENGINERRGQGCTLSCAPQKFHNDNVSTQLGSSSGQNV